MVTYSVKLTYYVDFSQSLKEKRAYKRKIVDRIRHRFNVCIIEVDNLEHHKKLTLGLAVVAITETRAQNVMAEIIRTINRNIDADLIEKEIQ